MQNRHEKGGPDSGPALAGVRLGVAAIAVTLLAGAALAASPSSDLVGRRATAEAGSPLVHGTPRLAARVALAWRGGRITTSTGEQVTVLVSDRYTPEQQRPETWAELLVRAPHATEVGLITVYIAPLDEVQQVCGENALGCYGGNTMYAPGDTISGVTPEEVVLHEYGHHIAANRLNPPWLAVAWGPKVWATENAICSRAAQGAVYPGDEGGHYELNPGEGWAEAYRVFAEQRLGSPAGGWEIVDVGFQPDPADLIAIERDVLKPWSGPTTTTFRKRMTLKTPRVWTIPLGAPLDGELSATVTFPRGANHEVVLLGPDGVTVVARGSRYGRTSQRLSLTVCGERPLALRVKRRGAEGLVTVSVNAAR